MNRLIENLENQKTSENRRTVVKRKKLLKALYEQWYDDLMAEENGAPGAVVEIGTGPGFIKEKYPNVLCSDIFPVSTADFVCDGLRLPLKPQSVKRIVMINVFHHVKDSKMFLQEMSRCLADAGCIAMIEPYNTLWGRFIWKNFHHENFVPEEKEWKTKGDDPLFSANGAIPWIVFSRDRDQFLKEFSGLEIVEISTRSFISYLLSGGFSCTQLIPNFLVRPLLYLDALLCKLFSQLGLFGLIMLRKKINASSEIDHKNSSFSDSRNQQMLPQPSPLPQGANPYS